MFSSRSNHTDGQVKPYQLRVLDQICVATAYIKPNSIAFKTALVRSLTPNFDSTLDT